MMAFQVTPQTPITGIGASTRDGLGVSLFVWQSSRSTLLKDNQKVDNPRNPETVNLRTVLLLDYRFSKNMTGILAVPHNYTKASNVFVTQTTNDLGDIAFYGKYSLYRDRLVQPTLELLGIAGFDLPTGTTKVKDDGGTLLRATQQPGSGTADFIVGGALIWGFPALSVYGDLTYKINTKSEYSFGNRLAVNVGLNYPIPMAKKLSLVGMINGEFIDKDKSEVTIIGTPQPVATVPNTGGETVYFSPGLQWNPTSSWSLSAGVQLPVIQNLEGRQLAASTNITLSISTRFGGKGKMMEKWKTMGKTVPGVF